MKNKKARWSLLSAFTAFTTYFERVKLSVNKKNECSATTQSFIAFKFMKKTAARC